MTTIKSTTKKGQAMLASARRCAGYELRDVYGSYSNAKRYAYEDCKRMCANEDGKNFHITSFNSHGFSVAWYSPQGVRIETPFNSYIII